MLYLTPSKALASRWRNLGLAAATLACTCFAALASEPSPRLPLEKEPAAWQRAGIEAALQDPAPMVQFYTLDYCRRKKWVAQLHLPTAQWLKWLALHDWDMQSLAAEAAVQMGAQTPPEVQRELLRLLKDASPNDSAQHWVRRALYKLGGSMIPEAQMEMALFIQHPHPDMDLMMKAYESLGALGSAMTPATQESLLSFIQNPQADDVGKMFARDALENVGAGMQPQIRKMILHLLLEADTPPMLRSFAARALGRLGAEMPPQALEFLLSVLRDRAGKDDLRSTAARALALMGPRMPPEVRQGLLAAYDEAPPENADAAARKSHVLFHQSMIHALQRAGPEMPAAFQQRLVAEFLKYEHAARHAPPAASSRTSADSTDKERQPVNLWILAGLRPQPGSAVTRALLAEFQAPEAIEKTQRTIAEHFFQPLADRGALPPEVQQALLTCLQDEKAEEHVRCLAAETLGRLGAGATPAAKQALLALLQDRTQPGDLYCSAVQAMSSLGPHMPPEAASELVGILRRNIRLRKDPRAAAALSLTPDPFVTGASATTEKTPATRPKEETWGWFDGVSLDSAVHALGNLGEKMTPEAQTALLEVIEHHPGNYQTPWAAAYALAQMGDKLPQQRLLALLFSPGVAMEPALYLACHQTLGVSGIHPVTDAQVADLLARTHGSRPHSEQRFYFYLWLGRTPAHLQAVRWLGHTDTDPPLGDTPPQEVLSLISRFWPHSTGTDAAHTALRHAMARCASQLLTTSLKTRPLDESTRKVLSTLVTQLATDPAPDCAAALKQVQAALGEDVK